MVYNGSVFSRAVPDLFGGVSFCVRSLFPSTNLNSKGQVGFLFLEESKMVKEVKCDECDLRREEHSETIFMVFKLSTICSNCIEIAHQVMLARKVARKAFDENVVRYEQ